VLPPSPRHLLVVDDHPLVLEGLVGVFSAPGLGLHCEGAAGIVQARHRWRTGPAFDVVLADQRLPDGDGLAMLVELAREAPRTAGVLLSGADDQRLAVQARQAGLAGYLSKSLEPAQIVAAVQRVLAGGTCFPDRARASTPELTARQVEVMQRVCCGRSSKEIARELGVSERTVKDHLAVIFLRLGVNSRAEAVARAGALGLLDFRASA
jgi:two-component system, NarL family, nitrate/nitrite response regulator NarL